jgi:16S rRNA G966 N2-methylase RsmD
MKTFLRKIISSSLFWKLRHYVQPDFIESYKSKQANKIILDFINKETCKSKEKFFFDFGCSCGSTLLELASMSPNNFCVGVDINKKSLNIAKNRFEEKKLINQYLFDDDIESIQIKELLNSKKEIYLSIFDRVLYCINDIEFEKIKLIISKSRYVFIDDFFLEENRSKKFSYRHRDYQNIMKKLNFICLENYETKKVIDANACSAIFMKIGID